MITHQVKNYTILALFVMLLISGGLNIIQLNNAKREQANRTADNLRNQIDIAGSRALAEAYRIMGNKLEADLISQRDSFKVSQKALYDENRSFKKKIERLRPLVAQHIDSIPDLRDFVASQDSLIVGQDSLIMSLEFSCMTQIRSFEEIIRLNRAQINEQVSVSNNLQEMLVSEQGKNRKEKRKRKFWRTVSVAAAGGIAFLLLKPN